LTIAGSRSVRPWTGVGTLAGRDLLWRKRACGSGRANDKIGDPTRMPYQPLEGSSANDEGASCGGTVGTGDADESGEEGSVVETVEAEIEITGETEEERQMLEDIDILATRSSR